MYPPLRHSRRLVVTLAVCVSLLAGLLVSPAPASAAITRSQAYAAAVVKLLNAERAAHHLRPLTVNADLVKSAHGHNLTMARFNTMSHQLPREAFFATRISRAGYRWQWAGENIGWNSAQSEAGVLALQKLMYNERAPYNGHRLNILSPNFRNVGVDVYLDAVHHKLWLTEDFGRTS